MRKYWPQAFATLIIICGASSVATAHPGNTDSSGCHTYRTNCSKWGLDYGQYHCHNGGYSGGGTSSTSTSTRKTCTGKTGNGYCSCETGYQWNSTKTACTKIVTTKKKNCKAGYALKNNVCVKKK